jgi:hypothetical protein
MAYKRGADRKHNVSLRLSTAHYEMLKRRSEREDRSMANTAERIVIAELERGEPAAIPALNG